jgi:putative glutamine amidotransferase
MLSVGLTFGYAAKAEPYRRALRAVGLDVVDITPDHPVLLNGLAGLVVSGGSDIQPALYGAVAAQGEVGAPHPERDTLESELLRGAIARDVPVLAICRGLQMLNVVRGGGLIQHLDTRINHRQADVADRSAAVHAVRIAAHSRLASILQAGDYEVNSRHHQAADPSRLGAGLTVSAMAPDGVIEGLELPDAHFVVAVQWHPEDSLERDLALFEEFAAALL